MNDLCMYRSALSLKVYCLVWKDTRVPISPGVVINELETVAGLHTRNFKVHLFDVKGIVSIEEVTNA